MRAPYFTSCLQHLVSAVNIRQRYLFLHTSFMKLLTILFFPHEKVVLVSQHSFRNSLRFLCMKWSVELLDMINWLRLKLWPTLFQCSFHLNYPYEVPRKSHVFENSLRSEFFSTFSEKLGTQLRSLVTCQPWKIVEGCQYALIGSFTTDLGTFLNRILIFYSLPKRYFSP